METTTPSAKRGHIHLVLDHRRGLKRRRRGRRRRQESTEPERTGAAAATFEVSLASVQLARINARMMSENNVRYFFVMPSI